MTPGRRRRSRLSAHFGAGTPGAMAVTAVDDNGTHFRGALVTSSSSTPAASAIWRRAARLAARRTLPAIAARPRSSSWATWPDVEPPPRMGLGATDDSAQALAPAEPVLLGDRAQRPDPPDPAEEVRRSYDLSTQPDRPRPTATCQAPPHRRVRLRFPPNGCAPSNRPHLGARSPRARSPFAVVDLLILA